MTTPTSIMIFAAGFGTRMLPLTADRPKPLVRVAGKPLLDHALDLTRPMHLRRVVNVHYLDAQIRTYLDGTDVLISDETDRLRDTGGGLRHALGLLGNAPVFTLNTDAVWKGKNPLSELAAAWDPARMDALLLMIKPENAIGHKGRGDFLIDADGRLTRGPGPIYAGAQIIKTDSLAHHPQDSFSLNTIWDQMADGGRLFGVLSNSKWCDVGHPGSIALAETMIGAHDVQPL